MQGLADTGHFNKYRIVMFIKNTADDQIMPTAMDVANFFIDLSKDTEPMTMLRATKMVYFAQGCSLACLGEPLFDEDLEAWDKGPAARSVYDGLKRFRDRDIRRTVGKYSDDVFTREQINLMIDVQLKYGKFTTSELIAISHAGNGPWTEAYEEGKRHIKIPKDRLRDHFKNRDKLERFDMGLAVKNLRPSWPRDPAGRTIVPADFDE